MRILLLLLLCTGCAASRHSAIPPLPPGASTFTVAAADTPARAMAAVVAEPPTCTNCARIFGWFRDPEISPGVDGFVTQWDQLMENWSYDFQTAGSPAGPWTTRFSGVWSSSDPNSYFGLELPMLSAPNSREVYRALGGPVSLGLAAKGVPPPLLIRRKGDPWKRVK